MKKKTDEPIRLGGGVAMVISISHGAGSRALLKQYITDFI